MTNSEKSCCTGHVIFQMFLTLAEFILETENRLRRETRLKMENSSDMNPEIQQWLLG